LVLAPALAATTSCSFAPEAERSLPGGYVLVQKADYQALYDSHGRIERLLQDADGDGRAESVVLYYPNGTPRRGEIDTDGDGVVDRVESFRTDGTLETAPRKP
jgi:hypothetical protein